MAGHISCHGNCLLRLGSGRLFIMGCGEGMRVCQSITNDAGRQFVVAVMLLMHYFDRSLM